MTDQPRTPMLRVIDQNRPPINITVHNENDVTMWIDTRYVSLRGELVGVGIVAGVKVFRNTCTPDWGDFAAYIGAAPGYYEPYAAARFIRSNGEKLDKVLSELLFRTAISKQFPDVDINWRA